MLNDEAGRTFEFNHPEVKIINIPKRFKSVGEKRNATVALCSYDLIAVWDDDDIFLPHRLSFSVDMLVGKQFFKPSKAFTLSDGRLSGPTMNLFHSGAIWSRSLFDQVRGYAHMVSGQDLEIEQKMEKVIGSGKNFNQIQPHEVYYVYRWGGTGSYHLSGFGKDKPDKPTGVERIAEYVVKKALPKGHFILQPKWLADYSKMVAEHIKTLDAQKCKTDSSV